MATHSSIPCLENPHRQRSLVSYSPWGRQELDTTERLNTAQTQGILKGKVSNDFKIFILCNYPAFSKWKATVGAGRDMVWQTQTCALRTL